jgi:hypothetical protein
MVKNSQISIFLKGQLLVQKKKGGGNHESLSKNIQH